MFYFTNKKGFTLTELIIVIAILGILAAVLVPSMMNSVTDSKAAVSAINASHLYMVAQNAWVKLINTNDVDMTAVHDSTINNLPPPASGTAAAKLIDEVDALFASKKQLTYSLLIGADGGIISVTLDGTTYPES